MERNRALTIALIVLILGALIMAIALDRSDSSGDRPDIPAEWTAYEIKADTRTFVAHVSPITQACGLQYSIIRKAPEIRYEIDKVTVTFRAAGPEKGKFYTCGMPISSDGGNAFLAKDSPFQNLKHVVTLREPLGGRSLIDGQTNRVVHAGTVGSGS